MEDTHPEFGWQATKNPTAGILANRRKQLEEDLLREYDGSFQILKKDVIDAAFALLRLKSIAELGCVWGVEGAYGLYMAERFSPSRVVMADALWTTSAKDKCNQHQCIEVVDGNFCDPGIIEKVGHVDAVVLFDLLLHLVNPDWNSVLRMYAERTSCFMIVNPQYSASATTIRLWDLGRDAYFEAVPHDPNQKSYARTFANPYEYDLAQEKILRDAFYVWQWGITNHDLMDVFDRLGFEPVFLRRGDICYGRARSFTNYGFVFVKSTAMQDLVV